MRSQWFSRARVRPIHRYSASWMDASESKEGIVLAWAFSSTKIRTSTAPLCLLRLQAPRCVLQQLEHGPLVARPGNCRACPAPAGFALPPPELERPDQILQHRGRQARKRGQGKLDCFSICFCRLPCISCSEHSYQASAPVPPRTCARGRLQSIESPQDASRSRRLAIGFKRYRILIPRPPIQHSSGGLLV